MPLVLGFAGLLGMVLLLDAAISGASFADVLKGNSRDLYRQAQAQHDTASPGSAGAATGTVSAAPATSTTASRLLAELKARRVPLYHGAFAGLTPGRVDQGKDYSGAGPVRAVADGVVRHVGLWHGWPGVGGVVYDTALGPVFVMEDFAANVKVGQRVKAGQIIGQALGGSHGIESGLANADYSGPLTPYGGRADGTPTEGGQAFSELLGGG